MPEHNDLDKLLTAVARGDSRAFSELYAVASGKLFAIAVRIVQNRAVADDVVQDVFVEVWRRAANFDPARGSAAAWLAVICRSRAIDAVRRDGRMRAASEEDIAMIAETDWSYDDANRSVELIALLECLDLLEQDHRSAILLAYYEGCSREELAERFGSPVSTVKTWLRRGLQSLRDCLSE